MPNKLFRRIMYLKYTRVDSYEIATAYASIGETGESDHFIDDLIAESRDYIDWLSRWEIAE